jgi:hypothetical protein
MEEDSLSKLSTEGKKEATFHARQSGRVAASITTDHVRIDMKLDASPLLYKIHVFVYIL